MAGAHSPRPLRVLVIEDSEDDVWLFQRELARAGFLPQMHRVETGTELENALDQGGWDVVLSDYALPLFDGHAAIERIRAHGFDGPVIVVSGAIGEELAASLMKAGAADFVRKGNLDRLGPVVERELREAALRQEHRAAQDALAASEARYRSLLEALPVGVFRVLRDGQIESANPFLLEMMGFDQTVDIATLRWRELLADRASAEEILAALDASVGPTELELELRRSDGSTFWAIVRLNRSIVEEGKVVQAEGMVTDVTRRRELEQALRLGKREWESTFDTVRELVILTDLALNVVRLNRAVAERLGAEPRDLVGRPWREVVGEPLPPIDLRRLAEASTTGTALEYDLDSPRLGADLRFSVTPRVDPTGAVIGAIHVGRDVTSERRVEELLHRQAAVDQAEHIFRIFRHETGNALNTLKTTLSVFRLNDSQFTPDKRETYFNRCFDSLRLAEQLLAALRAYQTLDQVSLRPLELCSFLRSEEDLLFATAREHGVACDLSTAAEPLEVMADPDVLVRVLLNLVRNAVDATDGRPDPRIGLSCRRRRGSAVIEVADNGSGITPEHMSRLFSPLFTTKRDGSGMGLAIVQKLALRMNAIARATSEPDSGATFSLHFPFPSARASRQSHGEGP